MPHFVIAAIPLNRPGIPEFLLPPSTKILGLPLRILDQRPRLETETAWLTRLFSADPLTIEHFLAIDHPAGHLYQTHTDRLVPVQFLQEDGFLTRNLGGWAPIFFGLIDLPAGYEADPVLRHTHMLVDYGEAIQFFGGDAALVTGRLADELGMDLAGWAASWRQIAAVRPRLEHGRVSLAAVKAYLDQLYTAIESGAYQLEKHGSPPLPRPVLLDELMGWLVRLEAWRREAVAGGETERAEKIIRWQRAWQEESGRQLILKGEYIVGRHRRSTVLIAPELGVVVKQPAPEPLHEVVLNFTEYDGKAENWPVLTGDKALVTPRGRIRQILEEGLIPRLHQLLAHPMDFLTTLGLTIEPFVVGPTVQEYVWADPARLTAELYDEMVLHQQVAEALGVENGDWHAANFVKRASDGQLVHIDWGAARSLRADELHPAGARARLNQVQNLGYSFHDPALAHRTEALHQNLLADPERLDQLRQRAWAFVR